MSTPKNYCNEEEGERSSLLAQTTNLTLAKLNLSYRKDPTYFSGRAGAIRVVNFVLSTFAVLLLIPGYEPSELDRNDEEQVRIIQMMGDNDHFSGYNKSKYTFYSMSLGGSTALISLVFILLLLFFIEVRCEIFWENINQKSHVLACILSVLAGFCDVLSIQEIQMLNCKTTRCIEEAAANASKTIRNAYEEEFYPPYFFYHYTAFVLFLANAMLYSIASRIWLRNED